MTTPKLVPEFAITDLTTSLAFYVDKLGFAVLYSRSEEGFAYLNLDGAELMLDQVDLGRSWLTAELAYPFGRGVNLQISVTNLDALHVRCSAEDIFLSPETKWYRGEGVEYGCYQFIVRDPDGYLLRFQQALATREIREQ